MTIRASIKLFTISAALAAGALAAPLARADALRVCADPDNLPFSKSEGPEKGLYVELAEMVAKRLGTPIEYTWWLTYYERRALRNTIQQDDCDAVFALPADAEYKTRGLERTHGFIEVSYAVVAAPSFKFSSLDDLKGQRVAVQFSTTPQLLLANKGGFNTTTYRTSDEVFDALAKGEVDVAFLWGPTAGYDNKRRFQSRWAITPVTGTGLGGPVAVAVRKDKGTLAADIDRALTELQPEIAALAGKYGFPTAKPILLTRAAPEPAAMAELASVRPDSAVPRFIKTGASVQAAADTAAADDGLNAGRVRFNDTCSHCHGSNGASPIHERDLRRLKARYDDKWREVATTTIKNGRPELGMPTWKDVLGDKEIEQVLTFLNTVQR